MTQLPWGRLIGSGGRVFWWPAVAHDCLPTTLESAFALQNVLDAVGRAGVGSDLLGTDAAQNDHLVLFLRHPRNGKGDRGVRDVEDGVDFVDVVSGPRD